jgi:hypothetical protein
MLRFDRLQDAQASGVQLKAGAGPIAVLLPG